VGTAILVFQKGGTTETVWFYDLKADGFSLTDTRVPIAENDIPDVCALWPTREEEVNSVRVPVVDIRANDFSLMIGRYKAGAVQEVQHDNPAAILDDVIRLEAEIAERAKRLKESIQT
jgi:type I restriction enzyme M protein